MSSVLELELSHLDTGRRSAAPSPGPSTRPLGKALFTEKRLKMETQKRCVQ